MKLSIMYILCMLVTRTLATNEE